MDLMSAAQLLGNIGEFVGAIAVVGTLVYLAIQVRQSKASLDARRAPREPVRRISIPGHCVTSSCFDEESRRRLGAVVGAFPGKDPTKIDRSAAYMARFVAKNLIASGIAPRCALQLAYAIGTLNDQFAIPSNRDVHL